MAAALSLTASKRLRQFSNSSGVAVAASMG
jgi:hypothetical protein